MKVSQHVITETPSKNHDGVGFDPGKLQSYGPACAHRECTKIFWIETSLQECKRECVKKRLGYFIATHCGRLVLVEDSNNMYVAAGSVM